jgi:hypothetical protein
VWEAVLPNLLFGREEGRYLRWSYVSTVIKIVLRTVRVKVDSGGIFAQGIRNVRNLEAGFSESKPEFIPVSQNICYKKKGELEIICLLNFVAFFIHQCYMFVCHIISGSSVTLLQPGP